MAGGYSDRASKGRVYVIYPNGTTKSAKGFIFRRSPTIAPGAEIIVPKKQERKNSDDTVKWISIVSGVSTLSIAIMTLINLVK